jgi:hypothetical protein
VVEVERMAGVKTLVDYARTKALNLGPLLEATRTRFAHTEFFSL